MHICLQKESLAKMKGIKNRKGFFKRIPMAAELLIGECLYFGAGVLIILTVTGFFFRESMIPWLLGFLEGVLAAVAIMIHMAISVEDSVSMQENEAIKHTRIKYIVRIVFVVVVFLLIVFLKLGDIGAALFGLMALKVSAYLQPFTHKIYQKFIREGR